MLALLLKSTPVPLIAGYCALMYSKMSSPGIDGTPEPAGGTCAISNVLKSYATGHRPLEARVNSALVIPPNLGTKLLSNLKIYSCPQLNLSSGWVAIY